MYIFSTEICSKIKEREGGGEWGLKGSILKLIILWIEKSPKSIKF